MSVPSSQNPWHTILALAHEGCHLCSVRNLARLLNWRRINLSSWFSSCPPRSGQEWRWGCTVRSQWHCLQRETRLSSGRSGSHLGWTHAAQDKSHPGLRLLPSAIGPSFRSHLFGAIFSSQNGTVSCQNRSRSDVLGDININLINCSHNSDDNDGGGNDKNGSNNGKTSIITNYLNILNLFNCTQLIS
jgi:hypothetical protein